MSQPAAGGAAFRVRLIAFVPICMALAVRISSNRLVYFTRSPVWLYSTRSSDPRSQGQPVQDRLDPNLNRGPVCGSKEPGVVG